MSTYLSLGNVVVSAADKERPHRRRLFVAVAVAVALVVGIAAYGFDYYILSSIERPFSSKHALLKPSGAVGLKLGLLGAAIFMGIFLYPIRKRIPWLAKRGAAKHWLDFHIVLGCSAPLVIAFHASFKFHGLAGMAFWIMSAVALSGIIGRYLYGQIPRTLSAAELSLQQLQEMVEQYTAQLSDQKLFAPSDLAPLLRLPNRAQVEELPAVIALIWMILLDLQRPIHVARLRLRTSNLLGVLLTLGGLLRTSNIKLEEVIDAARDKSSLCKRILFLSRAQQVFHLWHVVHRPFSYSFAVLALVHVVVVMLFGIM